MIQAGFQQQQAEVNEDLKPDRKSLCDGVVLACNCESPSQSSSVHQWCFASIRHYSLLLFIEVLLDPLHVSVVDVKCCDFFLSDQDPNSLSLGDDQEKVLYILMWGYFDKISFVFIM